MNKALDSEIKYENEGGPSLKECFTALDRFIQEGRMPGVDKLRLLKLVFFNYIIGNTDAHGKNFSILYLEKGITLAPCYDLLSTLVYSKHFYLKVKFLPIQKFDRGKYSWDKIQGE